MNALDAEKIHEHGEKLLKLGRKKSDFVLINVERSANESLEVNNNNIEGFDYSDSCSYVVTVWKDGKRGTSLSNRFSTRLIDDALKLAKANKKLEYFYGLPGKSNVAYPENFDKSILDIDEEKLVMFAKEIIANTKTDKVFLSKAEVGKDHSFSLTLNSNGVDAAEESTGFFVSLSGSAKDSGKVSTSYGSRAEPFFFSFEDICSKVRQECLDFLKAEKLKKQVKNVILRPEPLAELLSYAFLTNFNAKNVEKKQSCLVGKIGQDIFDKDISVSDNGILLRGINSSAVDFEGSPHRNTKLIDNGVLKNFIFDHNTALHAGKKSTGNSSADGIGFTNVVVDGRYNKIDEGLIIGCIIGAHTSNPLTTQFSVKADNCYHYKNGEKIPVTGIMLSGRMLDVLGSVISIDKKKEQNSGIYTGSLVSDKVNVIRH